MYLPSEFSMKRITQFHLPIQINNMGSLHLLNSSAPVIYYYMLCKQLLHYTESMKELFPTNSQTSSFKELCLLKYTLYSWVFGLPFSSMVKLMSAVGLNPSKCGLFTNSAGLRSSRQTGSHVRQGSRHAHFLSLWG